MAYVQARKPLTTWLQTLLRYRWHPGAVAYVLHRISGIALLGYLFVHISTLRGLVQGEASFNEKMQLFTAPLFKLAEWLLFAFVLFHALNGVRIALLDLTQRGSRAHIALLRLVYVVGALAMLGMGVLIFWDPFGA
jgi:succinate dehydrogenase / fumarate reductase cytochrome b subunit